MLANWQMTAKIPDEEFIVLLRRKYFGQYERHQAISGNSTATKHLTKPRLELQNIQLDHNVSTKLVLKKLVSQSAPTFKLCRALTGGKADSLRRKYSSKLFRKIVCARQTTNEKLSNCFLRNLSQNLHRMLSMKLCSTMLLVSNRASSNYVVCFCPQTELV